MKITTWNVNGIRSVLNKNALQQYIEQNNPDILCLQETKAQANQVEYNFAAWGYKSYWNSAIKKGYSGTAIFTKKEPLSVQYGINQDIHDQEGRIITLEFDTFYLVNVYTPNAKRDLSRLAYREQWEDDFLAFINALNTKKPVIFCGDLNVAHTEIDLANPKTNTMNAGFTQEERQKFTNILKAGYYDAFRYKFPDTIGAYTWWSYMNKARERNIGWRIDYFIMSQSLISCINDVIIRADILGSDHCPVELLLD
ncbi:MULTISPECIES: exodeoxyribonuclease III [unclassified Granulicatella]|uniref:exodeoxyribonuclease III n=1 Tax=unclassified Granulicatella TaxID=2630493 RepID=UPI00107323C0|nr:MULTISPECIES: exodeoxyribonuclease III [unclassified Granulicatella]MBF0780072.1 exodeoxyribonuclease III [Granulicatella sp. 19428wC4_WM01]TFU95855.1 exodeoxyribonuclease III [Granulicatella sp. WM01]